MGWVVRLAFSRLSMLLPVRRVAETSTVIVFEHPAPSWNPHLLLVPKRPIRSFLHLRRADVALFGEMLGLAFATATRLDLYGKGFAVMVNGGSYQDVAQVHLHLAGLDRGLAYATPLPGTDQPLPLDPDQAPREADRLRAFEHPRPQRAVHVVIVPEARLAWNDLGGGAGERLGRALVSVVQDGVRRSEVLSAGFTLLASVPAGGALEAACFHLVGGAAREPNEGPIPD
jgi:histidine triad (HIT) family protein